MTAPAQRRAVFLDRDGVLNEPLVREGKPHSPLSATEFRIVEGAGVALSRLKSAGYLLIGATNQPNVARGVQSRETIEEFHRRLTTELGLDDVRVCYHDDGDACDCRKPKPGLLVAAAREWGVRMDQSFMIGDRMKDVEAGRRAGCRAILVRHPYNEADAAQADLYADSLSEAADWILGNDLEASPVEGETNLETGRRAAD